MANKHFLVIVGSGASSALGAKAPVPMMDAWATSLFEDLQIANLKPGEIGIEQSMTGEQFELALGQFLRATRLIQDGFSLLPFYGHLGSPSFKDYVEPWLNSAGTAGRQIIEVIRMNLTKNFGSAMISSQKARASYSHLMRVLGDGGVETNRLVFATTNYDRAIEIGLEDSGWQVDDGFSSPGSHNIPWLSPGGTIERAYGSDVVPVLHLHGAVNWYVANDGRVVKQYGDLQYDSAFGRPAVLLPDPSKEPATDPDIGGIWEEFQRTIEECSHILIVGHGLRDQAITKLLRARRRPVAWAVPHPTSEMDRVAEALHEPTPVDLSFGPDFEADGLSAWLAETVP